MYKKIFICSNCGTEFEDPCEIDETDIDIFFAASCNMGIRGKGKHECIGGEIGMKVFKCFREVKK